VVEEKIPVGELPTLKAKWLVGEEEHTLEVHMNPEESFEEFVARFGRALSKAKRNGGYTATVNAAQAAFPPV